MAEQGSGRSLLLDGVEHQLALTEPATNNAIHGLARWTNWTATHKTSASVTMQQTLRPQPGYPFALELTITYSRGSEGLTVTTRAETSEAARRPMPAGSTRTSPPRARSPTATCTSGPEAICRRMSVACP